MNIVTPIKRAAFQYAEAEAGRMAKRARTYVSRKVRSYARRRFSKFRKRVTRRLRRTRVKRSTRAFRALARVRTGYVNRAFNTTIQLDSNVKNQSEILTTLTQGDQNDQRRGNKILLKGLKWNMEWNNQTNAVLYVNFALLTPIQSATVDDTNFFRDLDVENNIDFSTNAPTLNYWNKFTRAINRDKYIIHMHKRFILGPHQPAAYNGGTLGTRQTASSCNIESHKRMNFYLPLNSMVTFSKVGASEEPDQKIFYVVWYNRALADALVEPVSAKELGWTFETLIYFNNV